MVLALHKTAKKAVSLKCLLELVSPKVGIEADLAPVKSIQ
jgi:hypothetical protein